MAHAAHPPITTYAAYAAREQTSEVRHEWHDGIVVAMAGGTPRHGALAARIIEALGIALRGRPCQIFSSDVKVRVRTTKLGTYPDVSVVCGPLEVDADDPNSIVNPALLVEVLSESTEAYDRGAKFAQYRALPSLKAVLFVRPGEPGLELFVRRPGGTWELHEREAGELRIEALDIGLDVGEIYRDPLPV
ncbi:MAG TPA: Uma2 family endonuclease [Polyangiaceae bacterium]